jgi:16S rRNA processing protein RimM
MLAAVAGDADRAKGRDSGRDPDRTPNRDGARVCVGRIGGASGIRGWVRIASYTADPADIAAYGPLTDESGTRRLTLTVKRMAKGSVIATIDGVADRNAAEKLAGLQLYAERASLPPPDEEEFYRADLIGLEAVTPDGAPLGRIVAVEDYGAGDVIELRLAEGGSVLVPFTQAVVPVVDIAAGRVVIDPPPGLLAPVGDEKEGGDR